MDGKWNWGRSRDQWAINPSEDAWFLMCCRVSLSLSRWVSSAIIFFSLWLLQSTLKIKFLWVIVGQLLLQIILPEFLLWAFLPSRFWKREYTSFEHQVLQVNLGLGFLSCFSLSLSFCLSSTDCLTRSYYGLVDTINMFNVDGIFEAELKQALGNMVLTL